MSSLENKYTFRFFLLKWCFSCLPVVPGEMKARLRKHSESRAGDVDVTVLSCVVAQSGALTRICTRTCYQLSRGPSPGSAQELVISSVGGPHQDLHKNRL
jgi:hypothetical protein